MQSKEFYENIFRNEMNKIWEDAPGKKSLSILFMNC